MQLRDDVPPPDVLAPPNMNKAIAEAALDEWAHDDGMVVSAPPPWVPVNIAEAEWAMGMLRQLDAERAAIAAQAKLWRQQIDDWEQRASRPAERRAAFFDYALRGYGANWRADDPKRRTLQLPSGTVKATVPRSGTVVVANETQALGWLEGAGYGDAIKSVPDTVRLPELRQHVKAVQIGAGWVPVDAATGEQLPAEAGIAVEPPGEASYRTVPER